MSPEEITLVEASLDDVDLTVLASVFYRNLFQAAPETRPMFPADMAAQGEKFTTMLSYLIRSLRQWTVLEPMSRENGRRHVEYGVKTAHYEVAGNALVTALSEVSPSWGPETEQAWRSAYGLLAELMLSGARTSTG